MNWYKLAFSFLGIIICAKGVFEPSIDHPLWVGFLFIGVLGNSIGLVQSLADLIRGSTGSAK